MSTSSIVVMCVGIVVLWGGLVASILHAVNASRKEKLSK